MFKFIITTLVVFVGASEETSQKDWSGSSFLTSNFLTGFESGIFLRDKPD